MRARTTITPRERLVENAGNGLIRQAQAPEFTLDHDADIGRLVGPKLTQVTQPYERSIGTKPHRPIARASRGDFAKHLLD